VRGSRTGVIIGEAGGGAHAATDPVGEAAKDDGKETSGEGGETVSRLTSGPV